MAVIRAIGFDYSGVIATLPQGDIFDQIAQITHSDRADVVAAYHHYNHDFQIGRLNQSALWEKVAADLHAQDKFAEIWQAASNRLPHIEQPVLDFVDELRSAGYRTGLLSNLAVPTSWSEQLYDYGVDQHFDAIGLSGETGFAKPEPPAFRDLVKQLGVVLTEFVFIDDRASALAEVEALGIRPVLYHNLEQLKIDMRKLGVTWDVVNN